jgi:hypothetical protein
VDNGDIASGSFFQRQVPSTAPYLDLIGAMAPPIPLKGFSSQQLGSLLLAGQVEVVEVEGSVVARDMVRNWYCTSDQS